MALGQGGLRLLCEAPRGKRRSVRAAKDWWSKSRIEAINSVQLGVGTISRTWETRGCGTLILPPLEIAVHWSLVAAGVTGILLGFRVRAPALIVATAAIVVVGAVAGDTGGVFDRHRLLSILFVVVTLQCAYLIGLFLGAIWRRAATRGR